MLALLVRATSEGGHNLRAKLTSVCFRSMAANGLRAAVPDEAKTSAALAGLSGGGVVSCWTGLKWLLFVSEVSSMGMHVWRTIQAFCRAAVGPEAD